MMSKASQAVVTKTWPLSRNAAYDEVEEDRITQTGVDGPVEFGIHLSSRA